MNLIIRIGDIEPCSTVEGPGKRFTIWVQGCSIRCKGCWNKELWSFNGGIDFDVEELIKKILEYKNNIDGITLVGGEPLDQVEAILYLIKRVKEKNLSVMLYTGYTLEQINKDPLKWKAFKEADIVVYGPFIEEKKDLFLRWRGSSNQLIQVNNPRYEFINNTSDRINEVEIHMDENGEIKITGYPDKKFVEEVLKCLK